jgi:hypothetical protein
LNYCEHDCEDFLVVLKKNRKVAGNRSARREPAEALAAWFGAYLGYLQPLIGQKPALPY